MIAISYSLWLQHCIAIYFYCEKRSMNVNSRSARSKTSPQTSFNYYYNQPGSLPGTIAITQSAKLPEIVLIEYNQNEITHLPSLTPTECAVTSRY